MPMLGPQPSLKCIEKNHFFMQPPRMFQHKECKNSTIFFNFSFGTNSIMLTNPEENKRRYKKRKNGTQSECLHIVE
jgi:hypothetical protein